jgi:formimidoylglutamate deiminase
MYHLAGRLDPELMWAIARMAYLEMLLSGITTVGEFHYLQHGPGGQPYNNPDEMALQVVRAASDAGLRQVLLRVAYHRAGWQRAAEPVQQRFFDATVDDVVAAAERLRSQGVAVGLAPHSVRAVPGEWLAPLHRQAGAWDVPFHMHLSEQPAEVEACQGEHGVTPVGLLAREGILDERLTAVHAIHLTADDRRRLAEARAGICACPTTERNLGDGILPAQALDGAVFSLGSDSHTQINLLEDARELEYHLRLERLERVVLAERSLASWLWRAATKGGARALGLQAGEIAPGRPADLVAVSLDDPSLVAHDEDELLTNLVFSLERTAIRTVWVGGEVVVAEGRHRAQDGIVADYRTALRKIWP